MPSMAEHQLVSSHHGRWKAYLEMETLEQGRPSSRLSLQTPVPAQPLHKRLLFSYCYLGHIFQQAIDYESWDYRWAGSVRLGMRSRRFGRDCRFSSAGLSTSFLMELWSVLEL